MKILGLMGSPRLKGNTDLLLDEALEGAQSAGAVADKMVVCNLKIAPCRECYSCAREGNCIVDDDMQDVYRRLLDVDGIIVASPIFFYGLASQMKALIDRTQAIWVRKYVLKQKITEKKRVGAFIGVGATRGEQLFTGSILTVKYFFNAIDVKYDGELLARGVDKIGEVLDNPEFIQDAYKLGQGLAKKL